MAAPVTFLAGRAGSGKSRLIRRQVAELCARGENVALIVPEQFTFETERELAAALPGGLLQASVFSFTSLARRVLRETGERTVFLSRQGRRMVVRKTAEEEARRLIAYGGVSARAGFAEQCDAFFTECKRFNITPEQLQGAAERLPAGTPFQARLSDLALLYARTEDYLSGRNMDAADAFAALCERLPRSSIVGQAVIIDGFDLISEQLYDVIAALMRCASSLTISLRVDLSPDCRDHTVFEAERRLLMRLRDIARREGSPTRIVRLPIAGPHEDESKRAHPALRHLEHEGFAYPFLPYTGDDAAEAISLFAGTSRTAEAEAVADAILAAADRGIRYRDMAVIATDLDAYINPVSRALRARGIPFFTDAKHPLAGYAAARLVVNALLSASRAFRQRDVLETAKTGLAGVSPEDAEEFELYVLRYGMRGNLLTAPFTRGEVPPAAERARAALMGPLVELRAHLVGAATAGAKTEALYDYLLRLDVRGQLAAEAERLRGEGRFELMEECAQVYNMLMELFTQMHAILGDAPVSTERYIAVLQEGLSTYEVGVIPTTADQVLFGSLGRTRARSVSALFVLGAVEGVFPAQVRDGGMIDDEELAELSALGLPALPSSRERTDKELADVYGAVARPSRLLYLSYPLGVGAEAAVPCGLIDRITEMFPGIRTQTDIAPAPPVSAETGFSRLVARLRTGVDEGGFDAETRALYAAFASSPEYAARLAQAEAALFHRSSPEPFGQELAAALYGAPLYGSATRLETFNACPFKHFAAYGLRIEAPKEYRERRVDEGVFCHEALAEFTERLIALQLPAAEITPDKVDELLAEILPPLIAEHNNGVLLDTARMRALSARLVRRIKQTAHAIVRQLAAGRFEAAGCEVEFGHGKAFPPIELTLSNGARCLLTGKIDRLDSFTDGEGRRFLRVIDYKTGTSRFDFTDLYYGLKLQLPLYLAAATAADDAVRRAEPAGFYYLPVKTPVLDEELSGEALLEAVQKTFRLSGISLQEARLIEAGGGAAVIPEKGAGTLSPEEFSFVEGFARKKAAETAEAVCAGHAETAPFRKGKQKTACAWCDYASVCGFDPAFPGCAYRNVHTMKKEAFFEEAKHEKTVDK